MIYRMRVKKRRFGLTNGSHYLGLHLGKRSWYFPHKGNNRLQAMNVEDIGGLHTTITTHYKTVTHLRCGASR